MTITVTVDHAERKVRARAQGDVSFEEIRAHLEEEKESRGLPYRELIDARGYRPAFSSDQVRTIVSILRELGRKSPLGPTAIIVDSDVGYGMIRMIGTLVDDVCEIRPFRDEKEAEEWLARFKG